MADKTPQELAEALLEEICIESHSDCDDSCTHREWYWEQVHRVHKALESARLAGFSEGKRLGMEESNGIAITQMQECVENKAKSGWDVACDISTGIMRLMPKERGDG